jgi:lipopolysaccharide transport system permease protein
LYISPVGFSSNVIPEKWRLLYSVNPIVGVIDGFRWAITGDPRFVYLPGFFLSIAITIAFLLFGTVYFRKMERVFADLI